MNNKMPSNFAYPPGYVHPELVEDAPNHLQKLTFPGGFACYAPPNCEEVALIYNEIMVNQEYFQKGLSVLGAGCVIDIGANVGIFTMAVKLKAPQAAVYAFEPIQDTFQVLEQNVRLLGGSDIHLYNVAIGSQDHDEKTFTFFPYMPGNSTAIPALKDQQKSVMDQIFGKELSDFLNQTETRIVQVRTLSSVIREQGITSVDFLKIDVEGGEISVLDGIEEMHWTIFKQVAVETHTSQLREQVSHILVQHGFETVTDLGLSSPGENSIVYAHAT
ncbi:MAG: FkbM family methyltransferase [Anaerolineales bacterium]|jgi:FkbM family methyltransferase